MFTEEETQYDSDQRDPFPDVSVQNSEEPVRKSQEDVRDQKCSKHVRPPVCSIQYQQVNGGEASEPLKAGSNEMILGNSSEGLMFEGLEWKKNSEKK